jgi:hypothetical protein
MVSFSKFTLQNMFVNMDNHETREMGDKDPMMIGSGVLCCSLPSRLRAINKQELA